MLAAIANTFSNCFKYPSLNHGFYYVDGARDLPARGRIRIPGLDGNSSRRVL